MGNMNRDKQLWINTRK